MTVELTKPKGRYWVKSATSVASNLSGAHNSRGDALNGRQSNEKWRRTLKSVVRRPINYPIY